MNERQYKRFVAEMKRQWLPGDGLVVYAKVPGVEEGTVRICGARSMNVGLVLETCMIWNGDELEYNGAVGTKEMKQVLQRLKVCGARFCTARNSGDRHVRRCYKDMRTYRCGKCNYRWRQGD